MATVKIMLDTRRALNSGKYPVKLRIWHRSAILLSTDFEAAAEEWLPTEGKYKEISAIYKARNVHLRSLLNKIDTLLINLEIAGRLNVTTDKELRTMCEDELGRKKTAEVLLVDYLEKAKEGKALRTQRLFAWAQTKVNELSPKIRVTDIDEAWMLKYRAHLEQSLRPNTVAQGIAWVSRALSLAVSDGVIARNPASGIKKPKEQTRKKALSLESLRELRDMSFKSHQRGLEYARDIFLLQFYLLGINVVDLCDLKEITDGRIQYKRHKTGTLYSVKVVPEAEAIINKWRGDGALIDRRGHSASSLLNSLNRYLDILKSGLTTNYARHTWATLAYELDIPMETVSHALGHIIGSPVTAIYVAFNQKKVDEANRKVIDYLNSDIE